MYFHTLCYLVFRQSHIDKSVVQLLKVAQSRFQYFPRCRFWCVIITICYHSMLQSGYQNTAQLSVNTLVSFLWHNRSHYDLLKTPLISALSAYISKTARWNFFLVLNFDKQDKMQLLAKFKKILYMGFRATLNYRKFKVALNPMYRIVLNFAKSCVLSCFSNVNNIKKIHRAVFEI